MSATSANISGVPCSLTPSGDRLQILNSPADNRWRAPCTRLRPSRSLIHRSPQLPARIALFRALKVTAEKHVTCRGRPQPGTGAPYRQSSPPRQRQGRSSTRTSGTSPADCAAPQGRARPSDRPARTGNTQPTPVASGPRDDVAALRQAGRRLVKVFEHARASPVQVRTVLRRSHKHRSRRRTNSRAPSRISAPTASLS